MSTIARVLALPWALPRRFYLVSAPPLLGVPQFQIHEEDWSTGTLRLVADMGDNSSASLDAARKRRMEWEAKQPRRRDADGRALGDDWELASCGAEGDFMYYVTTDRVHASEVGALELDAKQTAELLVLAINATRGEHMKRGHADRAALIGAILDAVGGNV